MTQVPEPDVLVIGGDTRELRVSIAGQVYTLRPMSAPQVERFVREGGSDVVSSLSRAFAGETTTPDWAPLIAAHGPAVRKALHVATGIPSAAVDELDIASLVQLADVVMDLNLDFFVRRVRPALGKLVQTMMGIASQASPRRSQTTSWH